MTRDAFIERSNARMEEKRRASTRPTLEEINAELLAALKAYRRPAQWNHSEGCFCETCEMVRAAIAKAEGRS